MANAKSVWRERLIRFQDSGLTIKAFCELEGVSVSSCQAWERHFFGVRTPVSQDIKTAQPLK